MAKAPAFQFYYDRFNSSTSLWDDAQVGKYVRLMICQANKGFVSEKELTKVAAGDEDVLSKFVKISDGKFANEVLSEILTQRDKYSENRANNRKTGHYKKQEQSYENHMKIINSSQKNHMVVVDVVVDKESSKKQKWVQGEKSKTTAQIAFDLIPDTFHGDEFAVLWDDYEKLRRQKKKPLTETAVKQRVGQLVAISGGQWGIAKASMEETISSGWDRFFEVKPKTTQNGHDPRYSATFVKDKA